MKQTKFTGWSLVEAMVAIAIFAMMASALISLSVGALNPWLTGYGKSQAEALASEGLEAVRAIQARAWNELALTKSGLSWQDAKWQLMGENTQETIGDYTRQIVFSKVCRNEAGQIADCPATKTDPHLILVKAQVSWNSPLGLEQSVEKKIYLSNWSSKFWEQSDWSGGGGQALWSASDKYYSGQNIDDSVAGQLSLAKQAPFCQGHSWTFDNPDDYVYDSKKIEIVDGVARLKQERQYTVSDSPIDTQTFTQNTISDFPSSVKISDNVSIPGIDGLVDVYALTFRRSGTCELITMAINDAGQIKNIGLDSLVYDSSSCNNPFVFKVSDGVLGLVHTRGGSSAGYLRTVSVSTNGDIGSLLDYYFFANNQVSYPFVYKLPANQLYALAYNRSSAGQLATVLINDNGTIVRNFISQIAVPENFQYPRINQWSGDIYTFNYAVPSIGRDYLSTVNINSSGLINPDIISQYSTPAYSASHQTSFNKLAFGGAFTNVDNGANAVIRTLSIDNDGLINQTPIDSLTVASSIRNATLSWTGGFTGNSFLAEYSTASRDYIGLLDIGQDGNIDDLIRDSISFPINIYYHELFNLDATHNAVAWRQLSGWGSVSTFAIEEGPMAYVKKASIYAKNLYSQAVVDSWYSFSETANKNNGEVAYQLKTDEGNDWRYWDGSTWPSITDGNLNNPATMVNEKIRQLPTDSRQIGFKAILQSDGSQNVELSEVAIDCRNLKFETASLQVGSDWQTVSLLNTYVDPVIVASALRQANTLPLSVRLNEVGNNSFSVRLQNPSNQNLSPELVTYFVVENGLWHLGNLKMEAGKINTDKTGSYAVWFYEPINFKGAPNFFSASPVVLHQVMTNNDSRWIGSYVSSPSSLTSPPSASGMRIGLNAAETATSHQVETIGYLAIQNNSSGQIDGVDWETLDRANTRGYDNGCYSANYSNNYTTAPLTLVAQQTMNGSNEGSWGMMCDNQSGRAYVQVDEDQVRDAERSHVGETVGLLALGQNLSYQSGSSQSYSTLGILTSSAFNLESPSKIQVVEWQSVIPSPSVAIKFQVRSAPDDNGAPGTWSDWFGALGSGTYFISADGDLISQTLNGDQWVQYRVELSSDGSETPILNRVKLNYK